jgi:hypothetical protein
LLASKTRSRRKSNQPVEKPLNGRRGYPCF